MALNPFPFYDFLLAPADDDLWAKWKAIDIGHSPIVLNIAITLKDIAALNLNINRTIKYFYDPAWKTPVQTWTDKTGDCKDYATLKYSILNKLGLSEDELMIIVGEIKSLEIKNPQHAFCLAWIENAWRVLDNNFDHLIEPKDYDNFVPIKALSGNQIILFSKTFTLGDKNAVQS